MSPWVEPLRDLAAKSVDQELQRVGQRGERRALVLLDGERVGQLVETPSGSRFTYAERWLQRADAQPISLTMPLRNAPYDSRGVHPFFANLLPEGWLLDLSTAKLKLSRDDVFGLLLALCRDCVGAVEIWPAAEDDDRVDMPAEVASETSDAEGRTAR